MNIVLDSNVLINCISPRSKYHVFWKAFVFGKLRFIISTDILFEYEEILLSKFPLHIALEVLSIMNDEALVIKTQVFYFWDLIKQDPDNNKFADAAIAANADYIVTNDSHFKVLKGISFPKVIVVSGDEFLEIVGHKLKV